MKQLPAIVLAYIACVVLSPGANGQSRAPITAVRLNLEQIQLLSDVGLIRLGRIGLQGA